MTRFPFLFAERGITMAIYTGHNEDSSGNLLLSIGNGMTATVETTSTASQAYTVGSYIFFDNKLCKTTSAIASGATLAIGTNLSQTSLGAEITSHLRSSDGKEFYFDVKDGTYGYYPSASKVASEFVPFGGRGKSIGSLELEHGYYLYASTANSSVANSWFIFKKFAQSATNPFTLSYPVLFVCYTSDIQSIYFYNANWNNPETHYLQYCDESDIATPVAVQSVYIAARGSATPTIDTSYPVLYFAKTSSLQVTITFK